MTAHRRRRWRGRSPQTWPALSRSSTHPPRRWAAPAACAVFPGPCSPSSSCSPWPPPSSVWTAPPPPAASAMAAAMAVGRHGLVDGNRVVAWARGVEIPWRARVNDARLATLLADLNSRAGHPIREPSLRVGAGDQPTVELVEGSPGTAVDVAAAHAALAAAAASPAGAVIDLPVTEARPTVTTEAAETALTQARGLLQSPVTVRVEDQRSQLQPSELAPLIQSKAVDGELRVGLDQKGLDQLLRRKAPFAYTPGRDASFRISGSSVRVVPAVAGRSVQPGPAATALLAVATRGGVDRDIALPVASIQPEIG